MSVITFLSPIKDQFKSKPFVKDSTLFWFFYRLTVALHCLFALMVGGRAYFGDPIDCAMRKSQAIGGGIIDNYCWVTGTWTVKDKPDDQILAKHMSSRRKVWNIHPSVGLFDERFHEKVHHKYYQWVPFMLGLSAMLFYLPKFIWNSCEKANMQNICSEIDKEGKDMSRAVIDNDITIKRITKVLKHYMRGYWHKTYAMNLILCECLNGVIVVVVWFLTDYFLDFRFRTFGGDYHKFWAGWTNQGMIEPRNNVEEYGPLDAAFPKVTKCTFHSFGYSGTQQKHDGLCVLMLNIINEKCYLILWYWYVLAGIISFVILAKHLAWFLVPDCVVYVFFKKFREDRSNQIQILKKLKVRHTRWNLFVLQQISENVDAATWELLLAVFSRDELMPVPEKYFKHERGISYDTIKERVSRVVTEELREYEGKKKLEDGWKKPSEDKKRQDDEKKKFHQSSNSYERLPKPKISLDRHSSSSDYGTMKANKGDHLRMNMTLPSKRKPCGTLLSPSERNGHDGPYGMLSGSNRSLDSSPGMTDLDMGDNFVDASEMYNPVENQKNYDCTLRITDDEKKKEY